MSTFAKQLDELIKDTVGDIVDEKIEDANSNIRDDIDNIKYECEQMVDSYLSDAKDDILSEVSDTIEETVDQYIKDFNNKNFKIGDDDMRLIKDYIKALVDERIRNTITEMYKNCMKDLNGFVQSIPPYKGD